MGTELCRRRQIKTALAAGVRKPLSSCRKTILDWKGLRAFAVIALLSLGLGSAVSLAVFLLS